jgi:hypothetical protein
MKEVPAVGIGKKRQLRAPSWRESSLAEVIPKA